jgi:pimeloyl-ACP methyl ester carboxylesterase
MGRSDRCLADQWNLDVWADDVVRFCDALSIVDPYVLGASFGGMVAMRYLARHPGHAAKVVLMCTAAVVDVDAQLRVLDRRQMSTDVRHAAESFWRSPNVETGLAFMALSATCYSATGTPLTNRAVQNTDVMFHFLGGEMQSMNLLDGIRGIVTPVFVVAGALDPIAPAEGMTAIADTIGPTATLSIIDDAAHVIWADKPNVVQDIGRWLA